MDSVCLGDVGVLNSEIDLCPALYTMLKNIREFGFVLQNT